MIDWLTCRVAYQNERVADHFRGLSGKVVRYDERGKPAWEMQEWAKVEGSFTATINVRGELGGLWISGNPIKLLTGQNVDGPETVSSLLATTIALLEGKTGSGSALDGGVGRVTRVDCTKSIDLGRVERVREVLRLGSIAARKRHQGRAATSHDTIYFGKHSRRASLKLYCKADELKHHPPIALPDRILADLTEQAQGLLRIEATFRSMHLTDRVLNQLAAWDTPGLATALWREEWAKVQMPYMAELSSNEVLALPRWLRTTYELWVSGRDCYELMSRRNFYYHRKHLRAITDGRVDIATLRPRQETTDAQAQNLIDYLNSQPEWHATGLLEEWISNTAA
jgi:II/X family phage/plasmid replication protein